MRQKTSMNLKNANSLLKLNNQIEIELHNNTENLSVLSNDMNGLKLKVTDTELETQHLQDEYLNSKNKIDHLDEALLDKER